MSTKKQTVDNPLRNTHASHELQPAKILNFLCGYFHVSRPVSFTLSALSLLKELSKSFRKSAMIPLSTVLVFFLLICSSSTLTAQDADSDGVLDAVDWCPLDGGTVNAFGCPFPAVCDTIAVTDISFDTSGMNLNPGYVSIFVLADSVGIIVDTSSAPLFTGVTEGKYMLTALDYIDDGSLANFAIGDTVIETTANCLEWSAALTYRICPAEICNDGIDNDEDGDTDCLDSDCSNITLSNIQVSPCIDHPLRDVATVTVDVSWVNAPANDTIEVSLGDKTDYIFVAGGATSPQTIEFLAIADGSLNNEITGSWRNDTFFCTDSISFNSPTACSTDTIACNILYLCGDTKPADGDAWDHGIMNYLDAVNGTAGISGVLTKPDASGLGTYDPNSPATPVVTTLSDYDMIFISCTTEGQLAADLIDSLKNYEGSILNNNYLVIDDLGMSATAGGFSLGTSGYTDDVTQVELHNYDNIENSFAYLHTHGNYSNAADAYLWKHAGNQTSGMNGIVFHYIETDALSGITGSHGSRTYLGFHMNGIYRNAQNGGATPAPASAYFSPEKHLTLIGKSYFDQAIVLASTACNEEICNDGIDNDGDELIDCADSDCPNPAANATSSGPVCIGANLLLDEEGGEGVSWTWSGPSGASSNSQSFGLGNVDASNAGTYSVTVTGPNGCTTVSTVDVVINTLPTTTAGSNSAICVGEDLDLTESGGDATGWSWTGPNSFTSSAQNPTITSATALAAGTYNLTITDVNGCTATSNTTVTINTAPAVTVGSNSAICVGEDLDLTESGGDATGWSWTGPNSFTSSAQNPTITSATALAAGTYNLTITDANGCTATSNTTITINTAPAITVGSNSAICVGEDLDLTESGGDATGWSWTGPNSFTSSAQNPTITSATALAAGTYNLTITDANGCTATSNTTVTINTAPAVTVGSNSAICVGEDLDLTESGGDATGWSWTGPNSFTSSAQNPTITSATALAAGTYNLTITDANGCTATSNNTVTINTTPAITVGSNSAICVNEDLNLTESGGDATGWSWTGPNSFTSTAQNPTITSATALAAGTYNLTITDANGCTATSNTTVTINTAPAITAGSNSPVCIGADLDLTETGGDATGWSWTGPNSFTSTAQNPTITSATALAAGTYNLTITDANGCTAVSNTTVTTNATPTITIGGNSPICAGEDLNLTESGGAATGWSWTGPNSFSSTAQNPTISTATVAADGLYSLTITDANGCTAVSTIDIGVFAEPALNTPVVNNPTSCGGADGNITINATGGTGSYEYNIDGGAWGSSNSFTGLSAGPSYIVGLRNDNGTCEVFTGSIVLSDPSSPTATTTLPAATCQGTAASFTAVDAGVGATYSWDFGVGATPATATGIGPHSVTYSSSGTKTVDLEVTLAGCTASDSDSYTVHALPTVTLTPLDTTVCANAPNIVFTAPAGMANYVWTMPSGDASVIGAPSTNSIEIDPETTDFTLAVTITDGNGCTSVTQSTTTLFPIPTVTLGSNSPICAGNNINITETGGAADTWSWTGPNGFTSSAQNPSITAATTAASGKYFVTVTDANSCTVIDSITVVVNAGAIVTTGSNSPICITDSLKITESGGDAVSWSWTGPNSFTSTEQNPNIENANVNANGTYFVTITDANSCTNVDSVAVVVNYLPAINIAANGPVCEGDSLMLTEDGGDATAWLWDGPNAFTSTEQNPNIANTTALANGNYNVTITNANACTAVASVAVTVYTPPSITGVSSTDPSSCLLNDGTITVSASAGTGGIEYRVDGGAWQATGNFTSLAVGSHTVEIRNDNSFCIVPHSSAVVLSNPASPTAEITVPAIVCQGETASFTATDAGVGATYAWDFGAGATPATATGIGPHNVTYASDGSKAIGLEVTSAVGCVATDSEPYTVYDLPVVSLVLADDDVCVSETAITLSGGTPTGGTYSGTGVEGDGVTFNPSTATAGTHTITYSFTDANGCTNTSTDDFEVYALPSITFTLSDDEACVDESSFTLSGGLPAVGLYSGAGVAGDGLTFDPATAGVGTHTITYTVTDPNGCVSTLTDDLTVHALPVVTLPLTDDEACIDDGTLTLGGGNPSGGTYSGANVSGTTFNVATAGVGTHTVTYTYTNPTTNCTNSATADIEVYALPTPTLTLGVDEACVSETSVALTGGSGIVANGSYSGTAVTGSGPYVFNPSIAGVGTHTITYTYTDGNGCVNTTTDDIEVLALPVVNLVLGDDIACVDEPTITLSGGTPSGGTFSGAHVSGTTFNVATAGQGVHAVTYSYTDANGCTNTTTDNITIFPIPTVSSAIPNHLTTCGVNDGSITVTGSGGSGFYEYRINGGAWQGATVFSGLSSGNYTVDIRNNNGTCFSSYTSNPVTINEPPGATITASASVTSDYNGEDISCYGAADGAATAVASSGTAPYTYEWSNGQTGANLTNVAAGTYFVTATDFTSCEAVTSIEITQPDSISAGAILTHVSCFGGSDGEIDLNVTGGVNAFTYSWDDLSTEAFYNFDNNTDDQTGNGHHRTGLDGTEQYSTDAFFGSGSFDFDGNTRIRYDDGMGFLESKITELTVQAWIKPDDLVGVQMIYEEGNGLAGIALALTGNELTAGISRGLTGYSGSNNMTIPNDGEWHHVGLVFGDEMLTLFVDGVMGTPAATFSDIPINLTISAGGIGGGFEWNAFKNYNNYFFEGLIDNFSYHREALDANAITDSYDDDGDREGLPAGDYDVLVSDLNGCNTTITVTITEPDELLLDTVPTEVSCYGGSDGEIDLIVTGGTTPYNYNWSNGETTQDVNGLLPGVYDVTVTDNNGCTAITQSTIVQPDSLVATAAITSDRNGLPLSCPGASDGVVEATASAGRLPYTYLWDTGATTAEVTGLSADTYIVTITDDNGCTAIDSVTINEPPLVTVSITKDIAYGTGDVSCLNATDGAVTAVGADGVAPFTYEWSDGQSTATATGLGVGTYTVTVRDLNLCTNTASVTLVNPTVIDPNISITSNYNGEDVSCPAASDGAVYVEPTGGGGTYTYEWAHDNTLPFSSDSLTGLLATAYTVTVTDQFGCTAEASATLQNPSAVTSSITNNNLFSGFEVSCNGGADGNITANAGGGVGSYTYQWARNGTGIAPTTANITSVGEGTYTVTVSDANGCTSISNIDLTEPTPITFTAITSPPGDCGEATGIILVSASGGTGSFEYSIDGGVWQSSNAFFGLLNGTYDIRVRNQFGTCASAPTSVIVEVADAPVINNTTIIHPSTGASTDGGILVGASGKGLGTGLSLEYRLNGVTGWQSLDHFENLPVGTYTLEVRYSGQICITTQVLTLVAGQGVESSGTTLSFCSGDATATQLVETYYIPGPEDDLLNTFQSIYDADGSACGSAGAEDPVNPISTYVSIGIVESGTIIYYDHWEDGYEQNLSFPTTAPITQVWGDNDATNGIPPGFAVDYLSAADIIILSNDVDVNDLTGTSPYLYNGGDIIGSRGNISVTRLAWATGSGTLFAGALEVYPQETWGTDYTFPVGEDTDVNLMFSYTGAIVMAKEDGTVVNYVDNGTAQTITLAKGESLHIDGGIDAGDQVTASAPVQVHLLTGGYCQTFSSRFFTLKPTDQWASDYYNPVATPNDGSEAFSFAINQPTYVHLYNPDPVNSITVSWESNSGGVSTIPVASNGTAFIQIPEGTGTHFYTTNGANFYAIATIDSDPGINYAADWGFALLPGNQLTSQITMVGFAPGADPNTLGTNPENSSPIWITADYPPGSTNSGNITICVDHDGDGGAFTDANGIFYDEAFILGELDMQRIYDPDDNDQTGTRIWVCDGSDAIIAGAYGQDPATASGPLPAIDLGTGLPNGIPYSISKCANLSNDLNGNGKFDECDEVTYTVMVRNTGALPLSTGSLTLIDTLASELTYVNNSTIAIIGNSFTALLDDDSPASAFPFDEAGYQHNATVLPGDSIQFQFAVVINDLPYAALVNNTAYAASNGEALDASVTFAVETPVSPVLDNIPNDTIVTCGNVPAIPFQDTCQSIGLLSQYTWLLEDADSEASVAFNGEKAFDGSINSYWLTGSVGTTGCTDVFVSSIEDEAGIGNSTAVLGAPDGVGAELHEQSDQLTLDLGEVVAPGNTYTFTWRRGLSTGSNPEIFIYESSDDINYYLRSDGPYTTSNTTFFTETFAAEYNVRYIRVITQNVYDIDIDALSFESGCVSGAGTSLPHNLDIDLGAMRDISGFQYTPRQDDVAGRVEDFEFYVSTDGASWGAPVITGTYTGGTSPEIVNFPSVTGRYVRFVAISAIDGNEYTAVAELDVFACLITTTFAETNEQTNDGSCTDFDYDIYRVWTTTDFCGNVFLDSQYIQVQDLLSPTLNDIPTDVTVGASAIPVPPLTDCSLQTNIALGRPTTQIDTTNSGVPDRAVDGNTDGDFFNNSVIHTSSTFQPWWQVELDSVYEIDYVNVYNRTDCCQTRMSDFYVLVSSEPFTSDVLATNIADPDIHSVYFSGMAGMPSSISINAIGRYVRVQLSGTNEMNMAEFEVFPTCVSASDACDPDPVISFVETTSPIGCTYTITRTWTATDACGHSSEQTQMIDVSSTLSTLLEVTSDHNSRDISCVGGSDGEATVTINAGIAPLTYLWSGGETTNVVTGLGAGTHRVTITDGLGCQVIDSVTLIDPPPLNINPTITSNYNGEDIRCFDGSDGTAFVSATGGTGTKTFLWSNGATSNALTGLVAGTYTVIATDANGCTAMDSITLVEPNELALTMNLDNAISCVGNSDGAMSVSVAGGTGTYTYLWSNFNTSNSITSLSDDMYLVTVTDQNGCTAVDSLAMDDPAPLVVSFDLSTDPSLCEATDGEITISGTGGSGSFEFSQALIGPWSNTTNYNGLSAGAYEFYIRNADGTCPTGPFRDTLDDPVPSACPIIPESDPLSVCNSDISIPFSVATQAGATSYDWIAPPGMILISGQGTDSVVIAANNVAVGSYDICVITQSNCGGSVPCCFTFDVISCTEICDNGSDDDADGLVDCDDPDCGTTAGITLPSPTCVNSTISIVADDGGPGATYAWDFGATATPATATGIGPHDVTYDSCGLKTVTLEVTRGTCVETDSETLSVEDSEAPTADPLSPLGPFACSSDVPAANINDVQNETDNCSAVTVSYIGDSAVPSCGGIVTRTYRLTDICGNTTDLQQAITINDNVGPTFTLPADTTLYLDASCSMDTTLASTGTVTDTLDNCNAPMTVTYMDNTFGLSGCNNTGAFTRTWTVTDACNNRTTQTQTIAIMDTLGPVFVSGVPADVSVECSAIPALPNPATDFTVTDNCGAVASVTLTGNTNTQTATGACTDNQYTITRTWTATDACGNTTTAQQIISVDDTSAPTFTVPADTTLYLSASCSIDTTTASIGTVTGTTDACSSTFTATYVDDVTGLLGCNNTGSFTRTWTVTDACGNPATQTQTVTIQDTIAPTFITPRDTIVFLDVNCLVDTTITSIGQVTVSSDNCSGPLTIDYVDVLTNLSGCNATGTFTRTWTVTDACGNSNTGVQTVSIQDNTVPSADPLPDLGPYDCYDDIPAADITDVQNPTDNCAGTTTVSHIGDSAPAAGCSNTVIRTYRVTDACGNTSDLTQNILIDQSGIAVGGLTVDTTTICLSNAFTGTIGATPDGNAVVPCNNTILYILSTGAGLTIIDTSSTPDFALTAVGDYAIHTLIYDTVATSVNYLDLSVLNFGVTQLSTVEALLEQGGGAICGALDMTGAAANATSCSAALGDFVWEDQNEDGIQTVGEPGIEGVTVTLFDSSDNLIASTTTAANGSYIFNAIPSGTYYMVFDVSTNVNAITAYTGTQRNVGSPLTDSDINAATERTHLFIFDPSLGNILTVDAGYILFCPPTQRGGVNVIRK